MFQGNDGGWDYLNYFYNQKDQAKMNLTILFSFCESRIRECSIL